MMIYLMIHNNLVLLRQKKKLFEDFPPDEFHDIQLRKALSLPMVQIEWRILGNNGQMWAEGGGGLWQQQIVPEPGERPSVCGVNNYGSINIQFFAEARRKREGGGGYLLERNCMRSILHSNNQYITPVLRKTKQ